MNFADIRTQPPWSTRCEQWLAQFAQAERADAELLLDSVDYISQDEVTSGLLAKLPGLLSTMPGTVAFFPVTNVTRRDGAPIFPPIEDCAQFPLGLEGSVGSEGDLAHLCRDIVKDVGDRAHLYPSLDQLRAKRLDHIVLVTDTASSGDQVLDFLGWFWRRKPVRSWHSRKQVSFHVWTYLYTRHSQAAVSSHPAKPTFSGVQICQRGSPLWSAAERDRVEELCRKYGAPRMPFGYRSMMSLHVLTYSCPNNVPSILRHGSKRCKGLFGRRPETAASATISGPTKRLEAIAERFQLRASDCLAVVCYLLLRKPYSVEDLASLLGVPADVVVQGIGEAIDLGYAKLLRKAYRLTGSGRSFARSLPADIPQKPVSGFPRQVLDYIPPFWSSASSSSPASAEEEAP